MKKISWKRLYEQLESTIKEMPRKELLIIHGEWNTTVAGDAYEQWA